MTDEILKELEYVKKSRLEAEEDFLDAIVDARKAGLSLRKIASILGVSNVTVMNLYRKRTAKGDLE